jgi:periplasmic protein TonB
MAGERASRAGGPRGLGMPLGASALLHAVVIAAFVVQRGGTPPPMPPTYKVDLVAAPPGPRAQGVVSEQAPPATKPDAPPPPRATTTPEKVAPIPTRTPPRTDPAPPATPAPPGTPRPTSPPQQAGGGQAGGKGTDVANVRTEGIAFPYPGYLQNIVRQVALCFEPPRGTDRMRADVSFQVRRDGSVSDVRMVSPSGNYRFDNEAKGAIECAQVKFGALPAGFRDDVLPIVFSFDPSLLQ